MLCVCVSSGERSLSQRTLLFICYRMCAWGLHSQMSSQWGLNRQALWCPVNTVGTMRRQTSDNQTAIGLWSLLSNAKRVWNHS